MAAQEGELAQKCKEFKIRVDFQSVLVDKRNIYVRNCIRRTESEHFIGRHCKICGKNREEKEEKRKNKTKNVHRRRADYKFQ